jgi:hypothetical protein
MYHYYQIHCKNQQQQQTQTYKSKSHVVQFVDFIIYYLPIHEIKKLGPFEINGNDPFSKQYLYTQAKNNNQYLKYF